MNVESIILMNINKIEKAMCMPDRYKVFSQDIVYKLISEFYHNKQSVSPELINELCNTLHKYKNCLDDRILENKNIIETIELFLSKTEFVFSENLTINENKANTYHYLNKILQQRHTVRNFLHDKVDYSLIEKALTVANNLPSACNRQAGSLIIIENEQIKKEILSLQQGNKGFSAPVLAAIVVDNNVFNQAYEENAKYVYAGSFISGFILGLESLGLSSCLLNWHVDKNTKNYVESLLKLNHKEVIVFVYIGYAKENTNEAYSFKKEGVNLLEVL